MYPQVSPSTIYPPSEENCTDQLKQQFELLWKALHSMGPFECEIAPTKIYTSLDNRCMTINRQLAWFLQEDPSRRPTIGQVILLMAANFITTDLEDGQVEIEPFL